MTTKLHRYFWIVLLVFLTACGKQAAALPADTSVPVAVSPTPLPASTLFSITIIPSPLPTQPIIPVITPDPIQVERWKEYEDALAKSLLSYLPPEDVMCEWEILGQSEQEIYVWAVCMSIIPFGITTEGKNIFSSSSTPAVIRFESDKSIQNVEVPAPGIYDYHRLFPTDVQGRFEYYRFERAGIMSEHIEWRRTHLEEPPLIVLGATSIP